MDRDKLIDKLYYKFYDTPQSEIVYSNDLVGLRVSAVCKIADTVLELDTPEVIPYTETEYEVWVRDSGMIMIYSFVLSGANNPIGLIKLCAMGTLYDHNYTPGSVSYLVMDTEKNELVFDSNKG